MGYNVSEYSDKYTFEVTGASYIGKPVDNTVLYISKKVEHLLTNMQNTKNCLVFAEDTIQVSEDLQENNCFVLTDNPQREYANFVIKIAEDLDKKNAQRTYTMTAGGYMVGENVQIGGNAYIEPFCLIGHDVIIGKNARIFTGAKIKNAIIGDNFIANENCVIGAYGFNMAIDENGSKMRMPTLGKVVIGNFVEVGALNNIAVGSGGNTVLHNYVKLDALIHLAHDVNLYDNVEMPAGAIVGGYTSLDSNAYVGLNAVLRNRISIGENAVIGMGAVVTKDVPSNTTVAGNPAKPLQKKG